MGKLISIKGTVSSQDLAASCSRGELGDSLGALSDGVLGELTGEEETDGSLDLAGGEGVLLVVADEAGALGGDLLEDIVDERVHDAHGSLGDAGLGVHLLEDTVDVDGEGLGSSSLGGSLLGSGSGGAGSGSFTGGSLGHFEIVFCF
jgi:hypothetical protein